MFAAELAGGPSFSALTRGLCCALEYVVQASATHSLVLREGIQLCLIHEISDNEVTIGILDIISHRKKKNNLIKRGLKPSRKKENTVCILQV